MEIVVETAVSEVVVYPDRARITSRGRCQLDEGLHYLVIGDLPLVMEPESVRAAGAGSARVRLRSVDVQHRHYAQAPAANVLELENRIGQQTDAVQALKDRAAIKLSLIHI